MSTFQPDHYGPCFAPLLAIDHLRPLGAGSEDGLSHASLSAMSVEAAFAHARVADDEMARCCLSAIWLLHDDLEQSHTISQGLPSAEGSFWHGIMHRREGDFSNAKYWFRKVGDHPVFEHLGEEDLAQSGRWDPFTFVDACQAAASSGDPDDDRCRRAQQREWELLFDHCYRAAIGE